MERKYLPPGDEASYVIVREKRRNLAACVGVEKSEANLRVKLTAGVRIVGRCVNGEGEGMGGVRVGLVISPVKQDKAEWREAGFVDNVMVSDVEGRFEFLAISMTNDVSYKVEAFLRKPTERGEKEVLSKGVRGNVIDVGNIFLESAKE